MLMQDIIAPVQSIHFDLDDIVCSQIGALPLPFPNMDKANVGVCEFFLRSTCSNQRCPFRHIHGDKTVVCKHWLRGLCKKGDDCEFLHEYDMAKMPECYFFSKFGQCMNKECAFLHLDPESKIRDCPWYDRGFCRHGPNCKNRHTRKVLCQNYLCGFCPEGPRCTLSHPTFDLPNSNEYTPAQRKVVFTCDFCHETGHKASSCFKLPMEERQKYLNMSSNNNQSQQYSNRPSYGQNHNLNQNHDGGLPQQAGNTHPNDEQHPGGMILSQPFQHDVTCFKCGERGHYANKCTRSHVPYIRNQNIQRR
ncbi:unnamed protein product [Rotaria magnacalcarata]|uniref:Cleavage and polyadenylation specificity factor subunit 4 n=4 Tax=Rotaria magnacalcarata TaxID=392030 RepID=A0A816QKG5_9BILA|nr:unnamed protein product [Rotaria magnacalcarata]CAF2063047.1 unnamed protein product [Rotaria magnacalcarata]CAF2112358.1 unnamed protein product [Rotaria magnacalcarata]